MKGSKNNHLEKFLKRLEKCTKCPNMFGPPIIGTVKNTKIILIGQAPGIHEKRFLKPFSYTAGKTLFKWLAEIDIQENSFREKVNMSAVCRCFPGKSNSGDRKPDKTEIENCSEYLEFEIRHHKPELIIPVGKLAIDQLVADKKYLLNDVIGKMFKGKKYGIDFDWIPLPHPSGLNVWNNTTQGKKLIIQSLELIKNHTTFSDMLLERVNTL